MLWRAADREAAAGGADVVRGAGVSTTISLLRGVRARSVLVVGAELLRAAAACGDRYWRPLISDALPVMGEAALRGDLGAAAADDGTPPGAYVARAPVRGVDARAAVT